MELKIARIISYVFHPLLMPVFTFSLLFSMKTFFSSVLTTEGKIMILIFIFVLTFLFPAFLTYILLRTNKITSLHLKNREERTIPFIFTIVFYYGSYLIMKSIDIPAIYLSLILASTLMIILAFFINLKFKISIHTMAIGALTGIIIGISNRFGVNLLLIVLILFIIGGLVAYSRLALNAHRPIEVYSGYIVGFLFMFLLFILA